MLSKPRHQRRRGVTMIELMVTLTIMAFLLVTGVPSMTDWIRNSQIRSAAESILTGLQHARAEAVKRNSSVRFQLTSSLLSDCTLSTSGKSWLVNLGAGTNPSGLCNKAPSDAADPFVLQKSVAANASTPITVEASREGVTFNGFGQQTTTSNPEITPGTLTINIMPSSGISGCLPTGTTRCLRIVVTPAGQARMCDTSLPGPATLQPMSCRSS